MKSVHVVQPAAKTSVHAVQPAVPLAALFERFETASQEHGAS